MSVGKHGFRAKMKYAIDNFMSKGGLSIFTALMFLFAAAFAVMAVVRYVITYFLPEEKLNELSSQLWQVFMQIMDGGAIAEDTDLFFVHKIVGIVTVFLGLILFSSLVAFITSQFEAKLDELRKGKSNVIEKDHTLILGFGDRVLEIIRELVVANESLRSPAIVVLSEKEKDEMDDFFRERVEDRKTTRIITRSGSTSSIQLLERVGIESAKSLIILNDAREDAEEKEKELADARVLKTIMAAISCVGEEKLPPVVAELHGENKRALAKTISPRISIIDEHSILAKLMVQTSRISGLAQVYDNLVGFEGCEFYFYKPAEGFKGVTYKDVIFHFQASSVIGIRKGDGKILVNPPVDTALGDGDQVILIAEDDSAIKFLKKKLEYTVDSVKPSAPASKPVESQLIVGWSHKSPLIVDEYSKYLTDGSVIDVVVDEINDDMQAEFKEIQGKHPKIKMRLIKTDINNPDNMSKLKPEQYDNVIMLAADGGEAELVDSETISKLLNFRHYFKGLGTSIKTQLITEVADSENIEVIQTAGVKDFLISNRFVSKIYAQVSEEPEVLEVYDDLFCPEGSEVYIKPLSMYLSSVSGKISYGQLCEAALKRNETAFGIRVIAEEHDADKQYGIYINPDKNMQFALTMNDMLIVLAEDES